jgi:hypothetical protein
VATWVVQPRSPDGHRLTALSLWNSLTVTDRFNAAGPFSISGPERQLRPLMAPGMGVVLSRGPAQIMSGQVTGWELSGDGNATVAGWDDRIWLGGGDADDRGRIVYPDYTKPIISQEVTKAEFTGVREDLIVNLINQNAGPAALLARRVPRLVVPASLHRGGTTKLTVQLDLLHKTIATLAEQASLNVRVVHDESTGTPRLLVVITPVQDVSARVRFGPVGQGGSGTLGDGWSLRVAGPTMTDAVVGGTKPLPQNATDDDLTNYEDPDSDVDLRQYRTVADGSGAAAAWGRRVEGFVDASGTNVPAELDQAGLDGIGEATERREFSGTLVDTPTVRYGRDWFIGYRVGVIAGGSEFADVVREVVTTVQAQDGQQTERVEAAVGWSKAAVAGTAAATPQVRSLLGLQWRTYQGQTVLGS